MPEHILPAVVGRGSQDHLHLIILTVAIDFIRGADDLLAVGRETCADHETRYVYDSVRVVETGIAKLTTDMTRHGLAKRPEKDVQRIWQPICPTLVQHFDGRVSNLLRRARFNAPLLLATIRNPRYRLPYLTAPKIGSLWVRMLEDTWQEHNLCSLEDVPIPVDVHIARATVRTGVCAVRSQARSRS